MKFVKLNNIRNYFNKNKIKIFIKKYIYKEKNNI